VSWEYIADTKRVGSLIVQAVADPFGDASDPRGNDNVSTMLFFNHRRYQLGDRHSLDYGEQEAFEHGSMAGLIKHISRNESPVIGHILVGMYDHSGISIYPIASLGEHPWYDSGGWDSGCLGVAYVTQKRWIEMMGNEDPEAIVNDEVHVGFGRLPVQIKLVQQVMRQEIAEYNDWLTGNVWGYVVTNPCTDEHHENDDDNAIAACPHSDILDSCWGFVGEDKYAMEEGVSVAQWHVDHAQAS
jgi:hypothetical protein